MDILIQTIREYIIECMKDDSIDTLIKLYNENKGDKPPIVINMKNYIIENKKNGDKLLKKVNKQLIVKVAFK